MIADSSMVLRYVIPFAFDGSYGAFCQQLSQSPNWVSVTTLPKSPTVFAHLYRSVYGEEGSNSMGRTWQLDFHNKLPQLRYQADADQPISNWEISCAQVHIFSTNIGLFWYELRPAKNAPDMDMDSLILMQSRFKECSYTDNYFRLLRKRSCKEDPVVYDAFDLAVWLHDILRPLGELYYLNGSCIKGKNDDEKKVCPEKALIFNYVLMRSQEPIKESQLQTAAFWLANGYTQKYLPSQQALDAGLHPFRDVCLYASRSGCGCYAVENSENAAFFQSNFNENIRRAYFFLYILVLYQSFSLMNFSRFSASQHPSDPTMYNADGQIGNRLDQFEAELNTFLMKGVHTSVSNIQHHNEFYTYLIKRMMIKEDIESIKIGTEALVDLQHMRRERAESQLRQQETEDQDRQDRSLNIALAVLSLLSLFAAFRDLDELAQKLRALDLQAVWQQICAGSFHIIVEVLAYLVVLIIAIVCIGVLISNFTFKRKKKK